MKKILITSALLVFFLSTCVPTQSPLASPARTETIQWRHISSQDSNLPVPSNSTQQTASLVLDINKDGKLDFVIGARENPGPSLVWYLRGDSGWTRYIIEPSVLPIEAGGTTYDIDNDGDLDIVMGGDYSSPQIWWWENPYPNYEENTPWVRRFIKNSGSKMHHDQIFGDFDGDGQGELVFWNQMARKLYLAEIPGNPKGSQPWPLTQIYEWDGGDAHEGLAQIDIDGDGVMDIVGGGRWFKHNGGTSYTANVIDDAQRFARVAAGQLVDGGWPEIVFVSGDGTGPLQWYEWIEGTWASHTLVDYIDHGHSLAIADINRDDNLDIFNAEMRLDGNNPDAKMRFFLGDGSGNFILSEVGSGYGNHESQIADLDGDGDLDILGKPYNWETPRVDIWLNEGPSPLDQWSRYVVDDARPWQAVFITSADLDGDQFPEIITGGWWYKNPGTAGGQWVRNTIGSPLNNIASVFDFDQDGDMDILGTEGQGSTPNASFVWAQNNGSGNFTIFDNVSSGDGDFLQGVAVENFQSGGEDQVVLSWHASNQALQMLTVPADPTGETWPWTQLSTTSQDEDLSAGDIDGDLDLDLLLGTQWLRNDGSSWTPFTINTSNEPPDRNILADINQDNRLDAVVGFEAISIPGKLAWYQQGENPTSPWTEHLIATPIGPMSLDVTDMDGDGDYDVIVGEHDLVSSNSAGLYIYENSDGKGGQWVEHIVYTGDEHHDGTQVVDIDNDGDFDIISIGWSHNQVVLYENLSPGSTQSGIYLPIIATKTPKNPLPETTQSPSDNPVGIVGGLQALYLFQEGMGETVQDFSGTGEPLNLQIMNPSSVQWLPDGGLRINQATTLRSSTTANGLIQACKTSNQISIEAWIQPGNLQQKGPTRIVSLSATPYFRNFTLGQEAAEYQVRARTTATDENGIPAIETTSGSVKSSVSHVVYTRDPQGKTSLYVDGLNVIDTVIGGDFSNWDDHYHLILGNEMTGDRPWLGDYYWVAIYNRALSEDEVSTQFEAGPSGYRDLAVSTPNPTSSRTTPPVQPTTQDQISTSLPATVLQDNQNDESVENGISSSVDFRSVLPGIFLVLVLIIGGFWIIRKIWSTYNQRH